MALGFVGDASILTGLLTGEAHDEAVVKRLEVRTRPSPGVRPRAESVKAGAESEWADGARFPGLDAAEMTPAVQTALDGLVKEIRRLRQEVSRLKARLVEVEGLADRDALTPLLNRRAFARELHRVLTFTERYGASASLIYFDLDGFKMVNDRFGHAAGDTALQAVASRLLANVRESDVVGRLGGDEFGVILVHAEVGAATAKAAALAAAVEDEPAICGEATVPLKISYGVREIEPGVLAEQVLADADAAMFERKRTG